MNQRHTEEELIAFEDYADFVRGVYVFNAIANSDIPNKSVKDIKNQLDFLKEEVQEIQDGIDEDNPKEVLDGAVDVLYVTAGLLQILEEMGFDVPKALSDTGWNNLTKFPTQSQVDDGNLINKTKAMYEAKGVPVFAKYNPRYMVWSFKNANSKVMKPFGFVLNDLEDCIPVKYKGGFNG